MLKVPEWEKALREQQFDYKEILVVLFSQTIFDKVLREKPDSKAQPNLVDYNEWLMYKTQNIKIQFNMIKALPNKVKERFLSDT